MFRFGLGYVLCRVCVLELVFPVFCCRLMWVSLWLVVGRWVACFVFEFW